MIASIKKRQNWQLDYSTIILSIFSTDIESSLESSTIFGVGYNHKSYEALSRQKASKFGSFHDLFNNFDMPITLTKAQEQVAKKTDEEYLSTEEYIHTLIPVKRTIIKVNITKITKGKPSISQFENVDVF